MPSGYRIVLRRRTDHTAPLSQDPIARIQNLMFARATSVHRLPRTTGGRTGCLPRPAVRGTGAPLPAWYETACGMSVTPPCPRQAAHRSRGRGRCGAIGAHPDTRVQSCVCGVPERRMVRPDGVPDGCFARTRGHMLLPLGQRVLTVPWGPRRIAYQLRRRDKPTWDHWA